MSQSPWPPRVGEVSNGHQWNGSAWVPLAPPVGQIVNGHRWDGRQWVPLAPPVGQVVNGHQWDGRQWVPLAPPVGQVVNGHRWDGRQWVPLVPPPPQVGQVMNGHRWDGRQWVPLAPPPAGGGGPSIQVMPELRRFAEAWQFEWQATGDEVDLHRIIAEQRGVAGTSRLEYHATVRVDDARRELRFTEFLTETGAAAAPGAEHGVAGHSGPQPADSTGPGNAPEGIQEQVARFGRSYPIDFRYDMVREQARGIAEAAGYAFRYGPG